MGCSPSQAIIIQSSSTSHETVCLKPTIYMVSESTVKILQDVGELKVFHVDESDHGKIEEKYGHVEDQLANPLNYQPQVRSSRSTASGRIENTSLRGSTATIQSRQRLQNDSDSDIKLEDNNTSTILVESSEADYKNRDDVMLSETDKMQIEHVNAQESESTHNSPVKARQSSEQENVVEGNSSRNESKRANQFNPKFIIQNKVTPLQTFEMSAKEPFDTVTPVECEKMVRYNSELTRTIELASRLTDDSVATEENEQKRPDLSDVTDTEQETANNITISPNKEETTISLAAAQKNEEKEKESELRKKAANNDKHANSNKGALIKVESLNWDDE